MSQTARSVEEARTMTTADSDCRLAGKEERWALIYMENIPQIVVASILGIMSGGGDHCGIS